jgi:2-methylcitrate dehydratase PrpD
MGAATAVGALFELDSNDMRHALGIAASKASGIKGNFGSMTKPLHVGDAARSGLEAAELARGGFTANPRILELEFGGFCDLFEGEPGYDFEDYIKSLGNPWALLDPPVGFKPYPCCGSTHSAIDAALELRERYDIEPDRIKSVEISEHPRRLDHTNKSNPTTLLDGKFSVQYCVSLALLEGDVWLDHFDDETVTSEPYQSFLDTISVDPDREAFVDREWGSTVTIETPNDRHTVTVDAPKGSADRPMTAAERKQKYERCASLVLDDEAVNRSLEALHHIESVDDVGDIVDELV